MRVSFQILIILIIVAISGLVIYLWHPDRPPFYLVAGQLRNDEVELEQVLKWANDKGVVLVVSNFGPFDMLFYSLNKSGF